MLEWIEDITRFIFLCDELHPADIAFIPGNGHAEPSEWAATLYKEGFVPLALPSGRYAIGSDAFCGQRSGKRVYSGHFETEWDFMRCVLLQNGVPDHAILREDEAMYTYQNAIFSRRCTDRLHLSIKRAILCCMPVHARRAKMYYQTLYPEAELWVCPVQSTSITSENWMYKPEGIDAVLGELERCGGQFHDILRACMASKS